MHVAVTKTVKITETMEIPEWMIFALKGQKINAIKALRETAGRTSEGDILNLLLAKNIVEGAMHVTSTSSTDDAIRDITFRT